MMLMKMLMTVRMMMLMTVRMMMFLMMTLTTMTTIFRGRLTNM